MVGATLLLAACQGTGSAGPGQANAPRTEVLRSDAAPRNHCDAAAVAHVIGQPYASAVLERVLHDAGADVARMLHEDSIVTKEFQQGRINVMLDSENYVMRVYCG